MNSILQKERWSVIDSHHLLSEDQDIIIQNTTSLYKYDEKYYVHYLKLIDTEKAIAINESRRKLCLKYQKREKLNLLDIGIGSGEFIDKYIPNGKGYDINEYAVKWLKDKNKYINPYSQELFNFDIITFWDSLEHIPFNKLEILLGLISKNTYIMVSIPIFKDLEKDLKNSKHFKINEHLIYFTKSGFIKYIYKFGFDLREYNNMEIKAGREEIYSFVFRKMI